MWIMNGSPGRQISTPNEDKGQQVTETNFVYANKVKQLIEGLPIVEVLRTADLVLKDGDGVLSNMENFQRLNSLLVNQVASSWDDPQLANFLEWAGMNAPVILCNRSQESQTSGIIASDPGAPLTMVDLITIKVGAEETQNIIPLHVFSCYLSFYCSKLISI